MSDQSPEWVKGVKHPNTPDDVFRRVVAHDRARVILSSRCAECRELLSREEKARKEIVYTCKARDCKCKRMYGDKTHQVCPVCYDMWHALYFNDQMTNMAYFKNLDDKDEQDRQKKRGGS